MSGPLLVGFGVMRPIAVTAKLRAKLRAMHAKPSFHQIEAAHLAPSNPRLMKIALADSVNDLVMNADKITSDFVAVLCFDSPIVLMTVSDISAQDFDPTDKWSIPTSDDAATTKSISALAAALVKHKATAQPDAAMAVKVAPLLSLVEVVDRNTRPSLIGPMSGLLYSMQPAERAKIRESVAHWLLGKQSMEDCIKRIQTIANSREKNGAAPKSLEDFEQFVRANHQTYEREFSPSAKKKKAAVSTKKGITPFEAQFLRLLIKEYSK